MKTRGIVACGHPETAHAAEVVLEEGGNAFDAIVAAHFAACVAEPVLASLGGGGFLLAHSGTGTGTVYDFFSQTPAVRRAPDAVDFYPISADFGTTQQEFHIGLGAIAVPGAVRGMFEIHRELCTMPMARLVEPAVRMAREGLEVNAFQAYIFDIVKPIFSATGETRRIFGSVTRAGHPVQEGEPLRQAQLADVLERLAREGDGLFYEGEIAHLISDTCARGGGHLTADDLAGYRVIKRSPLAIDYRHARVLTNPPPSSGGILIAFALKLLEDVVDSDCRWGRPEQLAVLASVMDLTNKARLDARLEQPSHPVAEHLLDPDYLRGYREQVAGRAACLRGTTHMSIMDQQGNIASLTVSNGEGCGYMLPDTGIMLNNMLGEEDLNPHGFHRWEPAQRMTSMMAPSLVLLPQDRSIALGSGGSNRLRTAILQVLTNLLDFDMSLREAVDAPRIHYEGGLLNIEEGIEAAVLERLLPAFPEHRLWDTRNLFFGGVHSVMHDGEAFCGAGDPRRGGVSVTVE